jgi:rRNA maturation endonuclease Nob1
MALSNSLVDPYSPDRKYYECHGCGRREVAEGYLATCPSCGASVSNLAVPRE